MLNSLAASIPGGQRVVSAEEVFELAERRRARELADRLLQARTLQSRGEVELRDTMRSGARVAADEVARRVVQEDAVQDVAHGRRPGRVGAGPCTGRRTDLTTGRGRGFGLRHR